MSNVTAEWYLHLWAECPGCKEQVDLLAYQDFWEDRTLAAGENGTPASRDVEVVCPECKREFVVDCVF